MTKKPCRQLPGEKQVVDLNYLVEKQTFNVQLESAFCWARQKCVHRRADDFPAVVESGNGHRYPAPSHVAICKWREP